jgi:tetratricopeptide (TPR) repeat protein
LRASSFRSSSTRVNDTIVAVPCLDDQTILDLVEGRLLDEARRTAQAHAQECTACRKLLAGAVAALMPSPDTAAEGRAPPAPLRPGSRIGRYQILDLVGSGGMGVVYSAYDPELARRVALKLLRASTGPDAESQRARLLREARAIARVAHPHVVAVHDAGAIGDQVFIAMEFVEGATLSGWLRQKKRTLAEQLEVLAQAGRGLLAAHRSGLVHRDFKPDNVLVGRDGRVRVTDFGLARPQAADEAEPPPSPTDQQLRSSPDTPLTRTGAFVGTPAYMAPEQMRGEPIDPRSDVFSFCVAAWECLYGARPFSGSSAEELLQAARSGALGEPPPNTAVPARMKRLLQRGLNHSPDARPSLEELLVELTPAARGRGRALLLLGAVTIIALALLGQHFMQQARNRAMCRGGTARLAGVWDAPRKAWLRKALAGGEPALIDGVETTFDRYAAEWVVDYAEACEATHLRGEQSAESLELRMECLDQRRRELDAFVIRVADTPASLANAVMAAHRMVPLSECDNVNILRNILRSSAPKAQVDAMRTRLAHLRAFKFVSKIQFESEEARSLAEEALRTNSLDIAAGATQILAAASRARADFAAASRQYREAAMLAAMARDDLLLTHVLMHAAVLEGPVRANFDEAFRLIDYARSVMPRLPGNQHLQWELLSAVGQVEWRADRLKDAEEHYRQALAWMEHDTAVDPVDRAQLLLNLADTIGDQGRFEESSPLYHQSLEIYRGTLGNDHIQTLQLRNNLALDLWEAGKVDEAVDAEREVVAAYERRKDPMGLANALWTLGMFIEAGRLSEAESLYRRSLEIYEKVVGPDMLDLCYPLTGLGRVALARGRRDEAVRLLERALAVQNAPDVRESPDRAESELALAEALGSGPRALALATHARDVLTTRKAGVQRAALAEKATKLAAKLAAK